MRRIRFLSSLAMRLLLALLALALLLAGCLWWYLTPAAEISRGIVYGERHGHPLTLDVLRPAAPNGIGVLVMVSGSWKSGADKLRPWMISSFLRQGHTIFAVSHLSQPQASVMEIVEDVRRAARFVRSHAADYGIDPQRLGATGGSSGGHLSLMLATRGGPGNSASGDPLDTCSSAVQAAAVFFPVTDLLNLGPSTQNLGDGGPPKSFRKAFGPKGTDLQEWKSIGREVSPIYHVSSAMPPVYIIHGDADTLVPLEQSLRFQQRALEMGREVELTVRPGKKHGWLTILWDARLLALWFTRHLPPPP